MSTSEELRLESASFSHDGGRDYNEDAVGDSDAFGAVRLFMLADGAKAAETLPREQRLPRRVVNLCDCRRSARTR